MHKPTLPLPLVGQGDDMPITEHPDPAWATDCGEACLQSVALACGVHIYSVGNIRQSLGLPDSDGRTNGAELASWLTEHGWTAENHIVDPADALPLMAASRKDGGVSLALGYWIFRQDLHWRAVGDPASAGWWMMDPWYRKHVICHHRRFESRFGRQLVTVNASR